jgi:hypothetical protein
MPSARAVVIIEVKTDLASSEALGRKLDEKARLAPGIVRQRFGWLATSVARVVVMPETMRLRRLVQRHPVIGRMFPGDALATRRWLRAPHGQFAGLWFLSDSHRQNAKKARPRSKPSIRREDGESRAQKVGHSRDEAVAMAAAPAPRSTGEIPRSQGGHHRAVRDRYAEAPRSASHSS